MAAPLHTAFRFDIAALLNRFSMVEYCGWETGEDDGGHADMTTSRLEVSGLIEENRVCVRVFAIAPKDAGPGFRRMPDGSRKRRFASNPAKRNWYAQHRARRFAKRFGRS